jgi:hypothetical protein
MIPNSLIKAAVAIVLMVAAAGQLPRFVQAVRIAQYKILKESQASKWGQSMLLPVKD